MCWNVATAPLDNNVLLKIKIIKKEDILHPDLFLWQNGCYCDPVSAHSCSYGSLFAAWTLGDRYCG